MVPYLSFSSWHELLSEIILLVVCLYIFRIPYHKKSTMQVETLSCMFTDVSTKPPTLPGTCLQEVFGEENRINESPIYRKENEALGVWVTFPESYRISVGVPDPKPRCLLL